MSPTTSTSRPTQQQARDGKEALGRVGLVGKGALYVIIGVLAIQLASGDGGSDAGSSGAIEWVASQPFGKFLLVALTVSLFALAAWRLLDAVMGDPVEGSEASDRAKYAVKGVVYVGLAISALTVTLANWDAGGDSGGGGGGGSQEQEAAATILEWPAGQWIVGVLGLVIIGYALYLVKQQVVDQEYTERVPGSPDWVVTLGRAGYAARSVVFVLIGWFFVQAAVTYDPDEAKGLSGTLQELAGEGWGQAVLWGVAVGLLAFGLFCLAEARYRRSA